MSDIVHVRHPVPFRYVPRRSRRERAIHAAHVTPVALRRADPHDFNEVARLCHSSFHVHQGGLWMKLEGIRSREGAAPLGEREIADYLAGRMNMAQVPSDLYYHFARTPVRAMNDSEHDRGDAFDPRAQGRIVEDGTERAVAALTSFLDAGLRLVGDAVFAKACGPLATREDNAYNHVLTPLPFPKFPRKSIYTTRLDRIDEYWRFELQRGFLSASARHAGPVLGPLDAPVPHDVIPSELQADDDIRLFLNLLPRHLLQTLNHPLRQVPVPAVHPVHRSLLAGVERLRAWQPWAEIGCLALDDAEEIMAVASAVAGDADVSLDLDPEQAARLRHVVRYIDEIGLPRLKGPVPVEDDDLAAMAGIGPGSAP